MQDHPLTPMIDPDIRRWLAQQTCHSVGHIAYSEVAQGAAAIVSGLAREVASGRPLVVVDAVTESDLRTIAEAAGEVILVTGGSGIATGLPASLRNADDTAASEMNWQGSRRQGVVLSGSCSKATRRQVTAYAAKHPALRIDPARVLDQSQTPAEAANWVLVNLEAIPLVYATAEPEAVQAVQETHGQARTAAALEDFFGNLAFRLYREGLGRIVVAGGETSGAVIEALALESLQIGPEIAAGVPALQATGSDIVLALKSGNFGEEDFFEKAVRVLGGEL